MQDERRSDGGIPCQTLSPRKLGMSEDAVGSKKVVLTDEQDEIGCLSLKASPPIEWNPASFSTITKLNLPECGLSSLPSTLGTLLPNLSILFCSKNKFRELPEVIGSCPKLQMVSFKSNGMRRIHPGALRSQLRWLILTANELEEIPTTIGKCIILQKLMLSGNRLTSLPEEMRNCTKLELVRLASNRLTDPPMSLLRLPNLAWIAFSDNPFITDLTNKVCDSHVLPVLEDVVEGELLGRGASGVTHAGTWNGRPVAIKTYTGSMTSDGNPMQERALALAASTLSSPCLIQVIGQTANGSLVMELLENFTAFAGPPSMESCSRDTYQDTDSINSNQAISMVSGLLDALLKLHDVLGLCHGDFYGHNILVSRCDHDKVRLSDFGAAFPYDRQAEYGKLVERIEMRAFAHLVDEIATLVATDFPAPQSAAMTVKSALGEVAQECREDCSSFSTVNDVWLRKLSSLV